MVTFEFHPILMLGVLISFTIQCSINPDSSDEVDLIGTWRYVSKVYIGYNKSAVIDTYTVMRDTVITGYSIMNVSSSEMEFLTLIRFDPPDTFSHNVISYQLYGTSVYLQIAGAWTKVWTVAFENDTLLLQDEWRTDHIMVDDTLYNYQRSDWYVRM